MTQQPSVRLGCLLVTLKFEFTMYLHFCKCAVWLSIMMLPEDIPSIFHMKRNIQWFANTRSTVLHVCQNMFNLHHVKRSGANWFLVHVVTRFCLPTRRHFIKLFSLLAVVLLSQMEQASWEVLTHLISNRKTAKWVSTGTWPYFKEACSWCLFVKCRTSMWKYPSYSNLAS